MTIPAGFVPPRTTNVEGWRVERGKLLRDGSISAARDIKINVRVRSNSV